MRLLVFSDIHNNKHCLSALRQRESNEYDALVVAGDIGNKIADYFLDVCESFQCPTFFVHGNWDSEQTYALHPRDRCILLHHQIEPLGGFFFTGFSGHPIHWGNNPFYLQELAEVHARHQNANLQLAEIRGAMSVLIKSLDFEFAQKGLELRELKKRRKKSEAAHRKAREKLRGWHQGKLRVIQQLEFDFCQAEAYLTYDSERLSCAARAQTRNRQYLIREIENAGIQQDRIILVTHERQHKLSDEGLKPFMHIYGHRHRYECTKFKGTNYLNAASLDSPILLEATRTVRKPGGYCRVEISGDNVTVERVPHAARSVLDKTVDIS